jgi:hypothetical protein
MTIDATVAAMTARLGAARDARHGSSSPAQPASFGVGGLAAIMEFKC